MMVQAETLPAHGRCTVAAAMYAGGFDHAHTWRNVHQIIGP
jgi:hypothetical protein